MTLICILLLFQKIVLVLIVIYVIIDKNVSTSTFWTSSEIHCLVNMGCLLIIALFCPCQTICSLLLVKYIDSLPDQGIELAITGCQ